jgi:NAD(P)-dependent dehydrogenase (short-subunit alcohol dehydrogenase family)
VDPDACERVILISGAASGIGLATARAFSDHGATVHLADVDPGVRDRAAELGGKAAGHLLDVTDPLAWRGVVERILETDRRLDVLVNNAGVGTVGPASQLDLNDWRHDLEVDLFGPINGMHAVLPHMLQNNSGQIVNVASVVGLVPIPFIAPYVASKHALVGLSGSLDAELSHRGVRVSVVCFGAVKTGILNNGRLHLPERQRDLVTRLVTRFGTSPEKAARAIVQVVERRQAFRVQAGSMRPLLWAQGLSRALMGQVNRWIGRSGDQASRPG